MIKLDFPSATVSRGNLPSGARAVLYGVVISFVFTLVVFVVFAFLLTYTPVPDSSIDAVVFVTTVFAVMLSGIISGRCATSRGWLKGAVGGMAYVIILYILGAVFGNGFVFDKHAGALAATGFLSGAFGGVVGINLKKN